MQGWHKHRNRSFTCAVRKSENRRGENQQIVSRICAEGKLIRMHNSLHRISNPDTLSASFTVFRFVPQGQNQQECIKMIKKNSLMRQRLLKSMIRCDRYFLNFSFPSPRKHKTVVQIDLRNRHTLRMRMSKRAEK